MKPELRFCTEWDDIDFYEIIKEKGFIYARLPDNAAVGQHYARLILNNDGKIVEDYGWREGPEVNPKYIKMFVEIS